MLCQMEFRSNARMDLLINSSFCSPALAFVSTRNQFKRKINIGILPTGVFVTKQKETQAARQIRLHQASQILLVKAISVLIVFNVDYAEESEHDMTSTSTILKCYFTENNFKRTMAKSKKLTFFLTLETLKRENGSVWTSS